MESVYSFPLFLHVGCLIIMLSIVEFQVHLMTFFTYNLYIILRIILHIILHHARKLFNNYVI